MVTQIDDPRIPLFRLIILKRVNPLIVDKCSYSILFCESSEVAGLVASSHYIALCTIQSLGVE